MSIVVFPFFACGETTDLDTFCCCHEEIEICFANVDLYVRLILDIIL